MLKPKFNIGDLVYHIKDTSKQNPGIILASDNTKLVTTYTVHWTIPNQSLKAGITSLYINEIRLTSATNM